MLTKILRLKNHIRINGLLPLIIRRVELTHEANATFWGTKMFYLKCHLMRIKVGYQLKVFGNCIIRKEPQSRIVIGNNVILVSDSWRSSTANCFNCKLRT